MVKKILSYKATMHKLKSMVFYQLILLSNNLVLLSYLSCIYLESWFSWLGGGVQKTLKKENRLKKNTEKWRERKAKNKKKVK